MQIMNFFWKLFHSRNSAPQPRKILGRITTSEGRIPASLRHLQPDKEYAKRVNEAFRPTPSQRINK